MKNNSIYKKKKPQILSFVIVLAAAIVVVGSIVYAVATNKNDNSSRTDGSSDENSSEAQTTTAPQTESSKADTTTKAPDSTQASADVIAAFKSVNYYRDQNLQRYVTYKNSNTKLPYEQVILNVNIGLDRAFYTNTTPISDPASITVLVNKFNGLGSNYAPADLVTISSKNSARAGCQMRSEAAQALEKLCNDATANGYTIKAYSGYRSYATQTSTYNNYVNTDGKANADTYSARPGYSEHQTGLAMDVQGSSGAYNQFKNTKEYKYVQDNSYKYGFIIRYPEGKQNITGYIPEAWHLRYVGVDVATKIHNENITYDEYCAKYTNK